MIAAIWKTSSLLLAATSCAQAAAVTQVVGAGATFPFRVYDQAIAFYNTLESDVHVSYVGMGSSSGRCRLEDWATMCGGDPTEPTAIDFAGSDAIARTTEYDAFPDLQLYPVLAGAVVPIVNIPGAAEFKITSSALAQIFRGEITWWNDTRIADSQTNAVRALLGENKIEVVVRSSSSGTTFIFKTALSHFDAVFESTIGASSSASWAGLSPTSVSETAPYVAVTPFTIGYVVLGEAVAGNLLVADIAVASGSIAATEQTISAAVIEKGLNFGNNGDHPNHLTADISGALGLNAWPIVGYTYLAMRKDTLREGATCETRQETVQFWNWFLTSSFVDEIALGEDLLTLPASVLPPVLDRFRFDISCNGERIYKRVVTVQAPAFLAYMMDELVIAQYRDLDFSVSIERLVRETMNPLDAGRGILVSTSRELKQASETVKSVQYADVAIDVIYNLCAVGGAHCSEESVKIDMKILSKILSGEITRWDDADLVALNAWLADVDEAISVYIPFANSTTMNELHAALAEAGEDFTPSASLTAYSLESFVRAAVLAEPFSLGVTAVMGRALRSGVSVASVKNDADAFVLPSPASLEACVGSTGAGCYPLSMQLHVVLPTSVEPDDRETGEVVLAMAKWLFSKTDFVSYSGALTRVQESTARRVLGSVTSGGVSIVMGTNDDYFLDKGLAAVGIAAASVLLLLLLCLSVLVVVYRNSKVVKNSQPVFMLLLLLGLVLMICSVYPMSVDDRDKFNGNYDASYTDLDVACMSQVWLYFTGFGIAMSALLVKTYRIAAIFNVRGKKIQRKALTAWDVMPPFLIVNGAVFVLMAAWQIASPLRWDRIVVSYDDNGYPDESSGVCTSTDTPYFLGILLTGQFAAYAYGNYIAIQTKDVSSKFAESKWISLTIMSGLQTSMLTLPIVFINREDVDTLYVGKIMNVVLQVAALAAFMFLPKLKPLYEEKNGSKIHSEGNTTNNESRVGGSYAVADSSLASVHSLMSEADDDVNDTKNMVTPLEAITEEKEV